MKIQTQSDPQSALTPEELKAGVQFMIEACKAVADAIKELKQVPSGHLYAHLMGKLSLGQYEYIIGILIGAKLVKRDPSHLLHWVGPV